MRKLAVAGALVLAVAGCAATAAAAAPVTHRPARCVTIDINGRTVTGHEWNEPITFCGQGLPSGQWACPEKVPPLLGPGSRVTGCTGVR